MKNALKTALKFMLLMTLILGVIYPLSMTAIGQVLFHDKVNGQLVTKDEKIVGSKLLGQTFESPKYLHGRPQEVSQLSPVSKEQEKQVEIRIEKRQKIEGKQDKIPDDLVLASASGLDPDISLKAAQYQIPRIAKERQLTERKVDDIINEQIVSKVTPLNIEERVNVLAVNLALDELSK